MKKLLTAIICAAMIAVNFAGVEPARASQTSYTYAQAVTETAYFFTQKDVSTSLFAVPYTYCVRVVRDDGQWYYVQYAEDEGIYRAVYGYVLKSDFTLLDSEPPATYLFKSITVTYSAGDGESETETPPSQDIPNSPDESAPDPAEEQPPSQDIQGGGGGLTVADLPDWLRPDTGAAA